MYVRRGKAFPFWYIVFTIWSSFPEHILLEMQRFADHEPGTFPREFSKGRGQGKIKPAQRQAAIYAPAGSFACSLASQGET